VKCSCGATTWADIPSHARTGFGPRFTAMLAYLTALHKVTRRAVKKSLRLCLASTSLLVRYAIFTRKSPKQLHPAVRKSGHPFQRKKSSTLMKLAGGVWASESGCGFLPRPAWHCSLAPPLGDRKSSEKLWAKRIQEYSAQTCFPPTMPITKVYARSAGLTSSETSKD
jgi:hypothetical protein